MSRRLWTAKELAAVRKRYADEPTAAIAKRLGRPVGQVYQAAARLGLKKSAAYLAGPHACRLRRGDNVGKKTRYAKGHVPANKGLRRPGWAPGRMAETQFKPGVRQGAAAKNWCPIGTIRADGEGFLRIKVREGRKGEAYGFGNMKIWPLLNRHVWEQHNGAIPPGHAVCFKDGDRGNCDVANLELVSRADLARRNGMWNRMPRELAEVMQLNGALKRRLRRMSEKFAAGSEKPSVRDDRTA
jgi:hypothetical protein